MSLSQHLDYFNSIIIDLNNIDVKIKDEDQALIFLFSLPPPYKSIVKNMLYVHNENTLDEVMNAFSSNGLKSS